MTESCELGCSQLVCRRRLVCEALTAGRRWVVAALGDMRVLAAPSAARIAAAAQSSDAALRAAAVGALAQLGELELVRAGREEHRRTRKHSRHSGLCCAWKGGSP